MFGDTTSGQEKGMVTLEPSLDRATPELPLSKALTKSNRAAHWPAAKDQTEIYLNYTAEFTIVLNGSKDIRFIFCRLFQVVQYLR